MCVVVYMYTLMSNVCIVCIVFLVTILFMDFKPIKYFWFLISDFYLNTNIFKDQRFIGSSIKDEGFFFLNQYVLLKFH